MPSLTSTETEDSTSSSENASTGVAAVLLNTSDGATLTSRSVVLTGMDLTSTTAVTFGRISATFTVDSATQVTATTPAHAPGLVHVQLTWSGGTAISPVDYTYVAAPTISSVAPNAGGLGGGQTVIITGTNLSAATSVTFGGTPATSFTIDSPTQITAVNPAHAAGPLAGGQVVTITGANLAGAAAVTFRGVAATSFTVNSPTQITATTPADGPGAADVVVTTPGGSATLAGGYTFVA